MKISNTNLFYLDSFNNIVDDSSIYQTKKPPLQMRKVAGELVMGSLTGFLIGIAGSYVATQLNTPLGADELGNSLVGFFTGYIFGSPLGVYLIGNDRKETGSLLASYLGGILGALVSIPIFVETVGISPLILTPIGSTLAFNLTRHYKKHSNEKL